MKLTFHGGTGEVTGSNYLLESGDAKILVDCGLYQGGSYCEQKNFEAFPYDVASIAAVFVTHAHIDHTSRLPKLAASGFRGTIYSTPPTRDFAELLLLDSMHLLAEDAQAFSQAPLFDATAINRALNLWKGLPYHETITVGPFRVTLRDAGHILGSSSVMVEAEGKTIIFSGDLGNTPEQIVPRTETIPPVDYVVVESTYGDRLHEALDQRKDMLEDAIEDVVKRKGVLMIPAFAMERTQELLFELNSLVEGGRIPRVPVFIDSPLAIKLTSVYQRYPDYFSSSTQALFDHGEHIFNFPGLHTTLTTEESKTIADFTPPKIIIAGSGMSNGGRILRHEARYLDNPANMILFIGYQARGTLGRKILDGATEAKINKRLIPIRASVKSIPGYSAHADQAQLLHWLEPARTTIQRAFVVQGEEQSSAVLAQKIRDELAVDALVPTFGESVLL